MSVAELRPWHDPATGTSGQRLYLWCPGCDDSHPVCVDCPTGHCWTWDGNLEAPTINPSILVTGVQWKPGDHFYKPSHASVAPGDPIRCHSFVRAGRWEFGTDCTHDLSGQTVPLPPFTL